MTKYLEFDTPAVKQAGDLASDYRLKNHGLVHLDNVFWDLPAPALYEEAIFRGEGHMTHGGAFVVHTGKHTARAAADKFIVREHSTENEISWGEYNRPFSAEKFNGVLARLQAFLQGEELFVQAIPAPSFPVIMLFLIVGEDPTRQYIAPTYSALPFRIVNPSTTEFGPS